jgi:hypothetical protein
MKKLSYKNLSLLGLVLTGAAVVTALVIPAKSSASEKKLTRNGHIQFLDTDGFGNNEDNTCIAQSQFLTCTDTDSRGDNPGSKTSSIEGDVTSATAGNGNTTDPDQ